MAATYTPNAAFSFAKIMVKNMRLDDVQYRILDDVNKLIWMDSPWRWTIGTMTAVNLASSTQDYTVTIPGDYLYVEYAYLSDGAAPPRPLEIVPVLPTGNPLGGDPNTIAVVSTTLRVSPKPSTLPSSPTKVIQLFYKKVSPIISAANGGTAGALVMDDEWYDTYVQGVLWKAYQYADDPRAGGATVGNNGSIQYTGQQAIFRASLEEMRKREKLPIFDVRSVPDAIRKGGKE